MCRQFGVGVQERKVRWDEVKYLVGFTQTLTLLGTTTTTFDSLYVTSILKKDKKLIAYLLCYSSWYGCCIRA
jgi:hypothetical protein